MKIWSEDSASRQHSSTSFSGAHSESGRNLEIGSAPANRWPTAEERAEALDRYLSSPSPQPTLFYLLDKVERLAGRLGRAPATLELVGSCARQDAHTCRHIEASLVRAWNMGLIQVWASDAIELTPAGAWYVKEGRSRRLALWKVKPALDVGELCAILLVEDGDGPLEEVPLELRPTRHAGVALGPSSDTRTQKKIKVDPVWQGLLIPTRAWAVDTLQ